MGIQAAGSRFFAGLEVRRFPRLLGARFTTPRIWSVMVPEREKTVRKPEETPKRCGILRSRSFVPPAVL